MKLIPLTKGKFAMVDDEDYDRVMEHLWRYSSSENRTRVYTLLNKKIVYLNIFILGSNLNKRSVFKNNNKLD